MITRASSLLCIGVFVFGCGSSSSSPPTSQDMATGTGGVGGGSGGSGSGGGTGGVAAGDMAQPSGGGTPFRCGNMTCGAGTSCCVSNGVAACAASCPGGFVAECSGPDNCGGNPCCVTVSPKFMVHDVSCTHAAGDCVPNFDLTTQSGQDRGCHTSADCTAGTNVDMSALMLFDCCTHIPSSQHVCFNKAALLVPQIAKDWSCP
jgi:hypothetical protein